MVFGPWFFCLDTGGNILITDYWRHNIKILSPSGQLMHVIGRKDMEEENCTVHLVSVYLRQELFLFYLVILISVCNHFS